MKVRYVAELEAFMNAVAREMNCLPSFADPSPLSGNAHIMRKVRELALTKTAGIVEVSVINQNVMEWVRTKEAELDSYKELFKRSEIENESLFSELAALKAKVEESETSASRASPSRSAQQHGEKEK
jgi:Skp family chaperone for outer membrane proteins